MVCMSAIPAVLQLGMFLSSRQQPLLPRPAMPMPSCEMLMLCCLTSKEGRQGQGCYKPLFMLSSKWDNVHMFLFSKPTWDVLLPVVVVRPRKSMPMNVIIQASNWMLVNVPALQSQLSGKQWKLFPFPVWPQAHKAEDKLNPVFQPIYFSFLMSERKQDSGPFLNSMLRTASNIWPVRKGFIFLS